MKSTFLAFLALAACWGVASAQSQGSPRAVFAETTHDVGKVRQGDVVVHEFPVKNEGTAPLLLDRVDFGIPGLTARFPAEIAPGAAGKIRVELNTKIYSGEMDWEGEVRSNDPVQPKVTLTLSGVVAPVIEVVPMPAAYIRAYADETKTETLRVVNHDERPLKITRVEPHGSHFQAGVEEVEPGREFHLKITVPAGAPFGKYEEALALHTDHPTFDVIPVGVNILVQRDLQARPEAVDFKVIDLSILEGDPSLIDNLFENVTLAKREGEFAITGIRTNVPFLRVSADPPAGRSSSFRLEVQVVRDKLAVGPIWGEVVVTTDDEKFPEIVIPVTAEVQ